MNVRLQPVIDHVHKFIFVHIPKTGGTSILSALDIHRRPCHSPAKRLSIKCAESWKEYFTFSFVRNPWDKLVSYYWFYHQGGTRRKLNKKWLKKWYGDSTMSFKDYARRLGQGRWVVRGGASVQCLPYLVDKNEKIIVDFVGRFETIQQDFDTICDTVSIPRRKLSCLNKSIHGPYWEHYDDETRGIVAKAFKRDIEVFGYKFGD